MISGESIGFSEQRWRDVPGRRGFPNGGRALQGGACRRYGFAVGAAFGAKQKLTGVKGPNIRAAERRSNANKSRLTLGGLAILLTTLAVPIIALLAITAVATRN